MKYRMTLDYAIPSGILTPYFDALAEGRALASRCATCNHIAFPARTTCQRCAGQQINWIELAGTANILFRTDGPTGNFALVRFDGADTNSTVGLDIPEAQDGLATPRPQTPTDAGVLRGRLVRPPGAQPGLWLALLINNDENDNER